MKLGVIIAVFLLGVGSEYARAKEDEETMKKQEHN